MINYISKHYPINDYILGPNWAIIKPNNNDLEEVRKITYRKYTIERECFVCKTLFNYDQSNRINCRAHKVIVKCKICNKIFELDFSIYSGTIKSSINNALHNNKELNCFCSKECKNKNLSLMQEILRKEKRGWYSEQSIKSRNNPKSQTLRNLNAVKNGVNGLQKCLEKEKKDSDFAKIMYQARSNNGLKAKEMHIKPGICTICGKYVEHRNAFGVGIECLCANKIGFQPNFIKRNNLLYYFDKKCDDYILWDEYKQRFEIQNFDFNLPEGFKFYSTFRTQDSQNWSGANIAFEQNLLYHGIYWFVYIKFYIDKNNKIKPLVVGKSGSLNVNVNGSDLNFSEDINDGPARRFLKDQGLQWDKTKIAIYMCETESEAYEIEKKIALQFNLFGS